MKQYVYCKLYIESEVKLCSTEDEAIRYIAGFFVRYHSLYPFATLKVEFEEAKQ